MPYIPPIKTGCRVTSFDRRVIPEHTQQINIIIILIITIINYISLNVV